MRNVGMILLAFVAALALAGCGATGGGEAAPPETKEQAAKSPETTDKETGGNDQPDSDAGKLGHPSLGEADAPVVMTEYSDYQ